jgi:large subunit ribosomal protein L4e
MIALKSIIAATSSIDYVRRRYTTLANLKIDLPIVIKGDELNQKTKPFFIFLEKTLGDAWPVALQNKSIRAGLGKRRNRRYKKSAGLLLVTAKDEQANFSGIQVRKVQELEVSDLYPLGRLTMYTENAINELKSLNEKK